MNKQNKRKANKAKLIDTENRLVFIRREGDCGVGEMGEGSQLYGDR